MKRIFASLACAVPLGMSLTGCTVIGLGAGAVVDATSDPKYERRATEQVLTAGRDHEVIVATADGRLLRGRLVGALPPSERDPEPGLVVEDGGRVALVRESEIRYVDVETPQRAWLIGGAVGLGLDVIAWTALAIAASSSDFGTSSESSHMANFGK